MNPFQIICKSCAARLKVTKLTAIGQNLACPKCGTMVLVQPPTDWQPPAGYRPPSETADTLTTDFEDIESLLDKPDNPQSSRGKIAPPPPPGKTRPRARRPRVDADQHSNTESPVLPGQQWTSQASQKRKRLVLAIAATVGGLLIIGAIAVALIVSFSKSNDDNEKVAQGDQVDEVGAADLNENQGASKASSEADQDQGNNDSQPAETLNQTPLVTTPISQDGALDPTRAKPPSVPEANDDGFGSPDQPGNDSQTREPIDTSAPPIVGQRPPGDGEADPLDPALPQTAADPFDEAPPLMEQLGSMADLLEFSDTSIQQLQDQNLLMQVGNLNPLSRYYVEASDPLRLDLQRQLGVPLAGVEVEQPIPLSRMARMLARLSGVPVTIDARQLALLQRPVNPADRFKLASQTAGEALQAIANQFDLELVQTESGVILTAATSPEMAPEIFSPVIPEGFDLPAREELLATIKTLIVPEFWVREQSPGEIQWAGDELQVTATEMIRRGVGLLIRKLDAAAKTKADSADADATTLLQSRWQRVEPALANPSPLKPTVPRTMLDWLDHFEQKTGLTMLVDWVHVLPAGWTPETKIPGNIAESTVGKVVDEFANALDLTPVALDENTVILTTRQASRSPVYFDLEVYPISEGLGQRAGGGALEKLLFNALGNEVQTNPVKLVYQPHFRCVIVVAAQPIQRQVASILRQLER